MQVCLLTGGIEGVDRGGGRVDPSPLRATLPCQAMASSAPTSDLDGWTVSPFSGAGRTHPCYEKGSGPGVVLVPEVPGITPEVLGLGQHLVDEGFTVVIPSPFGTPGRKMTGPYLAGVVARLCIASEFRAFATNAHRPIADYLRALSRDLAGRTPGAGVGIIGMCFTGGFALAAAVDDSVLAPVLSQPSVPFPLGGARRADPGLSADELRHVVARTRDAGLCVLGLRFSGDTAAPADRFATLRGQLGEAFEVIELDSGPGNPGGFGRRAHSVLTGEVREEPGNLALAARARVVEFLRERLTRPEAARPAAARKEAAG
jgi:dienelactone hydrolase